MDIKTGNYVRDKITGFSGVVIARCEYMHQATQVEVASRVLSEGKPVKEWLPEAQVEVVPEQVD